MALRYVHEGSMNVWYMLRKEDFVIDNPFWLRTSCIMSNAHIQHLTIQLNGIKDLDRVSSGSLWCLRERFEDPYNIGRQVPITRSNVDGNGIASRHQRSRGME